MRKTENHKSQITLTVTLADGMSHSLTVKRVPANWKSALLRGLPYGTDYRSATFTRSDA